MSNQSVSNNPPIDEISQSEDNTTPTKKIDESNTKSSYQSDPEATPTKQTIGDVRFDDRLRSAAAPLASVDSDAGTPESTPKHAAKSKLFQQSEEEYLEVANELEIVEDVSALQRLLYASL